MNLKISFIAIFISLAFTAFAAKPIDEAKAAYNAGNFDSAIAQLQTILKRTPKDGTAQYYLGMSYLGLGKDKEGLAALLKAEDRGVPQASQTLAEIALDEYSTDDAEEHLDNWSTSLRNAKKSVPKAFNEMTGRLVKLKNMLERVEKIEVIDSITVDSAAFFAHYPLSTAAGKLLPASALPSQYSRSGVRMAYRPQSGREVIWAMPDSTGTVSLVSAGILDDGSMEQPTPFGGDPGEGGDADFPFLMPDGVTLYFANNGENSLGGYDIFMTRRNDDGTLMQPQNLGMPYNSTDNDYMLAIDETTGLGWWATDRNSPKGKVTIYTFIPAETRTNYDADDPDIAARARLTSIAATQIPGKDYASLLSAARKAAQEAERENVHFTLSDPSFAFSLGNGKVIYSVSDLQNPKARAAMKQWLELQEKITHTQGQLRILRGSYAAGDKSVASDILSLEKSLPMMRSNLKKIANQVVRLERGL